jgi:hypothetical protein
MNRTVSITMFKVEAAAKRFRRECLAPRVLNWDGQSLPPPRSGSFDRPSTRAQQTQPQFNASIDPPGSVYTSPFGINSAGVIAGQYEEAGLVSHGFIYDNGEFTIVDYPGASHTALGGINHQGQMVGEYGGRCRSRRSGLADAAHVSPR